MQNREPTGITAPLVILSDSITLATGESNSSSERLGVRYCCAAALVVDELIGDPPYGDPNTDGSRSIEVFYDVMREASVAARFMLIQAAVLGEYTSNHCVLREAWEARLTRQ